MVFPQQYGKYTLLKRLATGGMAEIFLARQAGMGGFEKEVVVKRLLPIHAENDELVTMFLDEARIAAHLNHPNISQIFDLGRQGDSFFIAMEFVHGVDLRRVCSQGIAERNYLPLQHAVRVVADVCNALAYAHSRPDKEGRPLSIVHRDVGPTNILLTFDGGVKLVDFGIAKAASQLTVAKKGQIRGKIGYMSPEQVRGDELDARSDLFSVGTNLYEITLGRRLFKADSDSDTLDLVRRCVITPPREVDPDYPEALEAIVMRALAPEPDERYAGAQKMQIALEDFLADTGMRSTAASMSEYLRNLFREQLELEVREGPALSKLATTMEYSEGRDTLGYMMPPPSAAGAAELIVFDGDTAISGVPEAAYDADSQPAAGLDSMVLVSPDVPEALMPFEGHRAGERSPTPVSESPSAGMSRSHGGLIPPPASEPGPEVSPIDSEPELSVPGELAIESDVGEGRSEGWASVDQGKLRKPRSYSGLLILLLLMPAGYGLYYLMSQGSGPGKPGSAIPFNQPKLGEGVAAGDGELPPPEPAKRAIIRFESEPPGARVVVNGNMLNSVTPTSAETFAGEATTVRMMVPGYLPAQQRLDAVPEAGASVNLTLEKGTPDIGALEIETAPSGVTVFINGNPIGQTPLNLPRVAAGSEMVLRLQKIDFHPHVVALTILKGESRSIGVRMVPLSASQKLGTIIIDSIPNGAEIREAGANQEPNVVGRIDKFPIKIYRKRDSAVRLSATLEGHEPASLDLDVQASFYTVYMRLIEQPRFYGDLSLAGSPKFTVYVGSNEIGRAPIRKKQLPEGEHTVVVLDEESGARVEFVVDVKRDESVERSVVLNEGKLEVN